MNNSDITYLGLRPGFYHSKAAPYNQTDPFGIKDYDRRNHVYLIGKTGMGKTTLLFNILRQDIEKGYGVGLLDPHGDLAEDILTKAIPPYRIDDIVYFNPKDAAYPIALNVLRAAPMPSQIASDVVETLKGVFGESWGPRLEYVLHMTIQSLAWAENTSLFGVKRMLTNTVYRVWVLRQVKDPVVQAFWREEFGPLDARHRQEVISPILNKVGQLFGSPLMRNILGQVRNRLDIRQVMDNRQIFIANLSRGAIGADKSNLLGSLLVSLFQMAAMRREDTPEDERVPFYLVADEFQRFTTTSFVDSLTEARKYRLFLTLANQTMQKSQIREEVRDAVLGSVGSIIAFRVGSKDAQLLEQEYAHDAKAAQFLNLKRHEILVRLQEDGVAQVPFSGTTLPPLQAAENRREAIIRNSRLRYAVPRAEVEAKQRKFLSQYRVMATHTPSPRRSY